MKKETNLKIISNTISILKFLSQKSYNKNITIANLLQHLIKSELQNLSVNKTQIFLHDICIFLYQRGNFDDYVISSIAAGIAIKAAFIIASTNATINIACWIQSYNFQIKALLNLADTYNYSYEIKNMHIQDKIYTTAIFDLSKVNFSSIES